MPDISSFYVSLASWPQVFPYISRPSPIVPAAQSGCSGYSQVVRVWCKFLLLELEGFGCPPVVTLYDLLYFADFHLGLVEYNVRQYTGSTATKRHKTKHTAQYKVPGDTLSQTHAHPKTLRDTLNARLL